MLTFVLLYCATVVQSEAKLQNGTKFFFLSTVIFECGHKYLIISANIRYCSDILASDMFLCPVDLFDITGKCAEEYRICSTEDIISSALSPKLMS